MDVRRLITEWTFPEHRREDVELGTDVRLNPDDHTIEIKPDSAGAFPTSPDLFAKTWIANPLAVKQWLGFEADVENVTVETDVLTEVAFRIDDGTDERYWDGGTWAVAGASDWNTEQELADNLVNLPATERKLGIVINVKSVDGRATPKVRGVKVLWAGVIEFTEDMLYRSLIPLLKDELRPIADLVYEMEAAGTSVDLGAIGIETPYEIVDVDSAFDHTNDPDHMNDILDSYNPSTKVVTFSQSVAQGDQVWVRFKYRPEVAASTSADYEALAAVPAVIVDDFDFVDANEVAAEPSVANKGQKEAVVLRSPLKGDYEGILRLETDKGVDHTRLADEIKRLFRRFPVIRSRGLDEAFSFWLVTEHDRRVNPSLTGIHSGVATFRIRNVYHWNESETIPIVTRMIFEGDANFVVEA
jgi:hypothetical protein